MIHEYLIDQSQIMVKLFGKEKKGSFGSHCPHCIKPMYMQNTMPALIHSVSPVYLARQKLKPTKKDRTHQSKTEGDTARTWTCAFFVDIIKPRRSIVSFMPSSPRRRQQERFSSAGHAPVCARGRPWSWHAWRPSPP